MLKSLLTISVLSLILGSTQTAFLSADTVQKLVGLPVIVFLAVATLHWLSWQFIVPEYRIIGSDPKSLIIYPAPRDFSSTLIVFGYGSVVLHCAMFGGYLPPSSLLLGDNGELVFGLILIGLGLAVRLRRVCYELRYGANPEQEAGRNSNTEAPIPSGDSTTHH